MITLHLHHESWKHPLEIKGSSDVPRVGELVRVHEGYIDSPKDPPRSALFRVKGVVRQLQVIDATRPLVESGYGYPIIETLAEQVDVALEDIAAEDT